MEKKFVIKIKKNYEEKKKNVKTRRKLILGHINCKRWIKKWPYDSFILYTKREKKLVAAFENIWTTSFYTYFDKFLHFDAITKQRALVDPEQGRKEWAKTGSDSQRKSHHQGFRQERGGERRIGSCLWGGGGGVAREISP